MDKGEELLKSIVNEDILEIKDNEENKLYISYYYKH